MRLSPLAWAGLVPALRPWTKHWATLTLSVLLQRMGHVLGVMPGAGSDPGGALPRGPHPFSVRLSHERVGSAWLCSLQPLPAEPSGSRQPLSSPGRSNPRSLLPASADAASPSTSSGTRTRRLSGSNPQTSLAVL